MSFYIYTFIFASIQTFLLLPVFSSYLYTPDFVTVAILYKVLRSQHMNLKHVLVPAFFLDMLYDSLGLNMSSKLLVFFATDVFKRKYLIASKEALIIFSMLVFSMEHAFKYLIFRIKYYYSLEPINLVICIFVETVAMFMLSRRIITQNAQT